MSLSTRQFINVYKLGWLLFLKCLIVIVLSSNFISTVRDIIIGPAHFVFYRFRAIVISCNYIGKYYCIFKVLTKKFKYFSKKFRKTEKTIKLSSHNYKATNFLFKQKLYKTFQYFCNNLDNLKKSIWH